MEADITFGNFRMTNYLLEERRQLEQYEPQTMVDYVLYSRNLADCFIVGMAPDEEPVYLKREERDVLFYGQAGVSALERVVAGELARMGELQWQRMIVVTEEPNKWNTLLQTHLGQSDQAYVLDVRTENSRKKAAEILREAGTNSLDAQSYQFTFVLDQVDNLRSYTGISEAISHRTWRKYQNITVLGSSNDTSSLRDYEDFVGVSPVGKGQTEIFGLLYKPASDQKDVHLIRIFS